MMRLFENSKEAVRYLFLLGFAFVIYYAIPKEGKFKYEFKKYEYWQHEDLIAPFAFPVKKSADEIENEKQLIKSRFKPYYIKTDEEKNNAESELKSNFNNYLNKGYDSIDLFNQSILYKNAIGLLRHVYDKGIINVDKSHPSNNPEFEFTQLDKNKLAKEQNLDNVINEGNVGIFLSEYFSKDSLLKQNIDFNKFKKLFKANLHYDKELSEREIENQINQISENKGLIEEGEKIIARDVRISPEKYQILESLRSEYESKDGSVKSNYLLHIGYIILILLIYFGFAIYLSQFYKHIYKSNKDLLLIYITITIFILLGAYASSVGSINIYLVPFCIVPIMILSFFDVRLSFISHLITILITSIFATNGYEFLFIQTLAGLATILSVSRVKYLSQFFISTLLILLVYYLSYFGIKLIQSTALSEIDYTYFLWFTGSFLLILLAYPLHYAYEKLFGKISDITLVELSDINKSLLVRLSSEAPGTFQHSLQVANLADAVLSKIGGDSLLARVGSLYHDIGKLYAPEIFTENQKGKSPHDDLNDKESAKAIIQHVTKGIELAKEKGLPKEIIDFIRTHHGTSRTEYFYRNYIKEFPEAANDDQDFRYPGPKPETKEQAVVMIVDTIEAASRSLKKPTHEMLEQLVDKLVEHKLNDNQFTNAGISLKDIADTKMILKEKLKSIYHSRIEYPEEKKT